MKRWTIMNTEDDIVLGYVEAPDEPEAIHRWLDEAGYDSIDDAANECFCEPEDIKAIPRGRLNV